MSASGLLIFARAPLAGEVKTRLIPALGAAGAAALYANLLRHAVATARASRFAETELWYTGGSHPILAEMVAELIPASGSWHEQSGTDLGARMACAFTDAFTRYETIALMGSDIPALSQEDLNLALDHLRAQRAVITPVQDGGYALIGLTRRHWQNATLRSGIFSGINWGGAQVMTQTRAHFAAAGVELTELPARWDVDTPTDLPRLAREFPQLLPGNTR